MVQIKLTELHVEIKSFSPDVLRMLTPEAFSTYLVQHGFAPRPHGARGIRFTRRAELEETVLVLKNNTDEDWHHYAEIAIQNTQFHTKQSKLQVLIDLLKLSGYEVTL